MPRTQVTGREVSDKSIFYADIDLSTAPAHPTVVTSDRLLLIDPDDGEIKTSMVSNLYTLLDTRYSLTTHNHSLASLSDTTITSVATGEILKWNGTRWINNTLAEAGIQAVGAMALSSLSDVTITTIAAGEVLKWSGSAWINNTLVEAGIAAAIHTHSYDNYVSWSSQTELTAGTVAVTSAKVVKFIGDSNGLNVEHYDASGTHTIRFNNTRPFPGFGTTVDKAAYGNHSHTVSSLTDTTITAIASGEILKWNGSAWINNTLAEAGIQAVGAMSLASLSDTTITSVAAGELLKWSGTAWINNTLAEAGVAAASHTHLIGSLTDVTISAVASGELLKWNGSAWINNTLAEAGIAAASHTHSYDNYGSWQIQAGGSSFDVTSGNYINFGTGINGVKVTWDATYHKVIISGQSQFVMLANNTQVGQVATLIPGLQLTLTENGGYEIEAVIDAYVSAEANGMSFNIGVSTGATFTGGISGTKTATTDCSYRISAITGTFGPFLTVNSLSGQIIIKGILNVSGAPYTLGVVQVKLTGGFGYARPNSFLRATKFF